MATDSSKSYVDFASRVLKVVAILVGGPLTLLALMSLVGAFVENGWARLGVALVAGIGVPALLADRLLPDDPQEGKGLVTDVLALCWLGFALAYIGLLAPATRHLMHEEAARHLAADREWLARATHWLAGAKADERTPATGASPAADPGPSDSAEAADAAVAHSAADAGAADKADAGTKVAGNGALAPEEIFKAYAPAVVSIQVGGSHLGGSGTGFVIDGDEGLIATNHHVIDGSTSVRVKLKDGRWARKVELLVDDEDSDLALLRISPAKDLTTVVLGDSDGVKVGERAISIGNPLGLEHTLTDGLVSSRRVIAGKRMIQMSTPISPGNSGGPLFNERGEVIGVSTASINSGFGASQNLNLAVPINTMKDHIADDYPDAKKIGGGGGPEKGTW